MATLSREQKLFIGALLRSWLVLAFKGPCLPLGSFNILDIIFSPHTESDGPAGTPWPLRSLEPSYLVKRWCSHDCSIQEI